MKSITSQKDPMQPLLDLLTSGFINNMMKCDTCDTCDTCQKKEKQNCTNDEMGAEDEQEEKKENQKGKADLFDKEEQRTIENKNNLDNLISPFISYFQVVQEQINNENNQIQQNQQLNYQLMLKFIEESTTNLSQLSTQQIDSQQCFQNIFSSLFKKVQQLYQQEIFVPPLFEKQKIEQLKDISNIVNKTIEKQEDFNICILEQPSQQFPMNYFGQDIPISEHQQTLNKSQRDVESEQTIKKGDKYKKKNLQQKVKQSMRNNFDDNLKQNINDSDAKIIYSYNNRFYSNNSDFYKCQLKFNNRDFKKCQFEYNDIQNHYIQILSQLSKWSYFSKKLSIQIYLPEEQFIQNFVMSFTQAITHEQNSDIQQKIDLTMTEQTFKWLDMILKWCDIYLVEIQKRQADQTFSQENLKDLQEFEQLLKKNQKDFNLIKQNCNEVLKISDKNIESIKQRIQRICNVSLESIIQKLVNNDFYVEDFVANGGEADILKGSFFIENEKKQNCIFRCIQTNDKTKKLIQNENDIVRSIQQPKNIIQYIDKLQIDDVVIFVVEECQKSLQKEIEQIKKNNKIEEVQLFQIIFDLVEGLIELRIHKIVHGDIKPVNILISQNGYCVLSDFGSACILEDEVKGVKTKGYTRSYASPEQLKRGIMRYKSDIYSLGKSFNYFFKELEQITCTDQTKFIMTSFKELSENYMVKQDSEQRLDCLQIFDKLHEIIFSQDYQKDFKSYLKLYLKKVELFINNNNFEFSQELKELKNFDYEYYKQVLKTYCILYIRLTFYIKGVKLSNSQIEENIKDNSLDLDENNIYGKKITFTIVKLGDYFRLQNDYQTALQCYKQSFNFQKTLEINKLISYTIDKIILCFTKLSKINETLEYLLEENDLCEVIFENFMKSYFDQTIKQICQNLQKDNDLQSILKGLDSLNQNQYKKQFFEEYIMLLRQIIEIYKLSNDNQNQLKHYIDLYQTIVEYHPNCDYYEFQKLIEDIIQLHDLCQQDYSHFIIAQLKISFPDTTSDKDKKILLLLYKYFSKYNYENNNMEISLEQFEEALKINKNHLNLNIKELSDIEQLMKNIQINLNQNNI